MQRIPTAHWMGVHLVEQIFGLVFNASPKTITHYFAIANDVSRLDMGSKLALDLHEFQGCC